MFTGLCAFPLTPLHQHDVDETAFARIVTRLADSAAAATILGLCGEDCLPRPLLPLSPDAFREIAETLRSLNLE